ncbi:hypothetical protein HU759_018235 [Pseudomonas sp. OE 28.3]|uniref:hypothetical protein n=1 Tax=Pseudomonas sp. OE 28.3 TaxID=2745519 RepID=UPI00164599EA|nr:hypothetical protein [Pseudomonas sp. OE 28.3]QXI57045.1 hypothetical protein HU759_018235 [Pseudomonas sp. OE 28.3]
MELKAAATVDVSPKGGQIAIFLLLAFSAISFGASVWLYMGQKPFILPLAGSIVFLLIGSFFWIVSHRNESLKSSHPFTLNLGEGEKSLVISADARSMPAINYIKSMLDYYSTVFHRAPLPVASGMIDDKGQPISGTESEAQAVTDKAHELAQQQCDALVRSNDFQGGDSNAQASPIVSNLV